jgi:hypothetical protein
VSLAIALLTVSDTRTLANDPSGDALQERLEAAGHQLQERRIVPDDRYRIRADVSRWVADPAVQGYRPAHVAHDPPPGNPRGVHSGEREARRRRALRRRHRLGRGG